MQSRSRVSYSWKEPDVVLPYKTGVSLHSHTSASEESLVFIHKMFTDLPLAGRLFSYYETACREKHNLTLNFVSANWRPPLLPRMVYKSERKQIQELGLAALISITDHDTMQAPLLLRTIPMARHIPVSMEWTAPYGATVFHLGIHNLPSAEGLSWMRRLKQFTAAPSDVDLLSLLRGLDAIPQVLIVLNHALWDLYGIGMPAHEKEVARLLLESGDCIHALELNGLRHARENREVMKLARVYRLLLVAGGDRHGLEANANINLTNASTFTEFVREIRVERRSHVLFLDQYAEPWEQRMLDSTLDAITDFEHFSPGWQRWDERAFHRDAEGVMRPLSELWASGRPPLPLRLAVGAVRLLRYGTLGRMLSLGFRGVNRKLRESEIAAETA